jgi:hypothetical protein
MDVIRTGSKGHEILTIRSPIIESAGEPKLRAQFQVEYSAASTHRSSPASVTLGVRSRPPLLGVSALGQQPGIPRRLAN